MILPEIQKNDYIVDYQTHTIWLINDVMNQNVMATNKNYFKSKFTNLSSIKNVDHNRILFANSRRNLNANYWWGNKLQ